MESITDKRNVFTSKLLENSDALMHTLSYLNIHELAMCSYACKCLAEMIDPNNKNNDKKKKNKDNDDDNKGKIGGGADVCWEGAEKSLAGTNKRLETIPTAKDHCRLFVQAANYAKLCDRSETMPTEGELGIGLARELMNIRGVPETVPSPCPCENRRGQNDSSSNNMQRAPNFHVTPDDVEEMNQQMRIEREEILREEPTQKTIDHEIFVRISRNGTNEMIGQGFVPNKQLTTWHAPLENQELELKLHCPSLGLMSCSEFHSVLSTCQVRDDGTLCFTGAKEFADAFRYTIVAVHKSDLITRLIRCTGEGSSRDVGWFQAIGLLNSVHPSILVSRNEFPLLSKWDLPSLKLYPCASIQYVGTCNLGISTHLYTEECVCKNPYPVLLLSFKRDPRQLRDFLSEVQAHLALGGNLGGFENVLGEMVNVDGFENVLGEVMRHYHP